MQTLHCLAAVIDLDITYFFQLVLFLLLVLVLNAVVFKPLLALMDKRRGETEVREREAAAAQGEADDLLARYQREIAQATAEGMAVRNRARDQALRLEADRLLAARASASSWLDTEVSSFVGEIEAARQVAQPLIEGMADDLVKVLSDPRAGIPDSERKA